MKAFLPCCLLALAVGASPSAPARQNVESRVNYDESKVGDYALEPALVFADGTPLKDRSDWPKRRAEIVRLFEREMYGRTPPAPESVVFEELESGETFSGLGLRRQLRMWFRRDRSGPKIDWLVVTPKHAKDPVPFFMMLNYRGNQTILDDPEVLVTDGEFRTGLSAGPRGLFRRSDQRSVVFVEQLLARGYGYATACYAEISKDYDYLHDEESDCYRGVFTLWPPRDNGATDEITALGAWAWVLSRGLDMAERLPALDATRCVVTGSSRLAKAALLAASRDERFAVAVINETGGGGVPLAKRNFGENVATEMAMFPHWYCKAYGKYANNEKAMTFDQHLLVASLAPRPVLVQGFDMPWFDTKGEYLACRAASSAWEFLGLKGLPPGDFPDDFDTRLIGSHLGYVRRAGDHGLSVYDWNWALDFADRAFRGNRK